VQLLEVILLPKSSTASPSGGSLRHSKTPGYTGGYSWFDQLRGHKINQKNLKHF